MAINWNFNASEYEEKSFDVIPEGEHRVRIADVVEKTFSTGSEGFEITLDVSGHGGKLWHYLVIDPSDSKKTNQRIGSLFNSFGITDPNIAHYRSWIGKVGAVKVIHEEYNGSKSPKVRYCIDKKKQDALPPANFGGSVSAPAAAPVVNTNELPFF